MKGPEIESLVTGPVLRTREGCRRRVALLSLGERWRLAYSLGLQSADGEGLARRLHDLNHKKKRG